MIASHVASNHKGPGQYRYAAPIVAVGGSHDPPSLMKGIALKTGSMGSNCERDCDQFAITEAGSIPFALMHLERDFRGWQFNLMFCLCLLYLLL